MSPVVDSFFDATTGTWSHIVSGGPGTDAAIIDPVWDFDMPSGRISTASAERVLAHVRTQRLQVAWILETHAHADHLTAMDWLKNRLRTEGHAAVTAIGEGICFVQAVFRDRFGLGPEFPTDGSQFDRLLREGDRLPLGGAVIEVLATPGHTNDSMSYRIGNAVFVGDTVFSPTAGTARCDFPGGDAHRLYQSIHRLYALPGDTRLYLCHDYPARDAEPRSQVPVDEQRQDNAHLAATTDESDYVQFRRSRDAGLSVPRLLYPALQVNIRAGRLPDADEAGRCFLVVPVTQPG
ncbi:MBL fold metallo-hydrolase [Tahibacter amnicola]|uniref:MBL fold metallo-hydrolase n=1 Tax=Tahibacter amnicola TaxID=2976241 RepID=A0ABY6BIG2_9GAMM|nr:MBL fold metallo-hydrolase [Tahibacter amnicola]UXI68885.1 MBL fold metallo-hydrolase [Tahibacter amnicola]